MRGLGTCKVSSLAAMGGAQSQEFQKRSRPSPGADCVSLDFLAIRHVQRTQIRRRRRIHHLRGDQLGRANFEPVEPQVNDAFILFPLLSLINDSISIQTHFDNIARQILSPFLFNLSWHWRPGWLCPRRLLGGQARQNSRTLF